MSVSQNSGSLLGQQELLTVTKLAEAVLEETLALDGVGRDEKGEEISEDAAEFQSSSLIISFRR